MAAYTGYLLGKVKLDGAIRSEVLADLVETLITKHGGESKQKQQFKFNENHRYSVECSERGLKLTCPVYRSTKGGAGDEGFESDCDSVRSIRITEQSSSIDNLDISLSSLRINKNSVNPAEDENEDGDKEETEEISGGEESPPSIDNGSILLASSSSSDDNNSSSGNGSDSDEFGSPQSTNDQNSKSSSSSSPMWEMLPNLSSFQSYPIEDLVFCHCDTFHPSTLVWVVRHLEKMVALVTTFRTRSEAEELFQTYRELRTKLKPLKASYKHNSTNNLMSMMINPILGKQEKQERESDSASPAPSAFSSLFVYPTEILTDTSTSSLLFHSNSYSSNEQKSLMDFTDHNHHGYNGWNTKEPLSRSGSNSLSQHNYVYISNPNIVRFGFEDGGGEKEVEDEDDQEQEEIDGENHTEDYNESILSSLSLPHPPQRPQRQRKLFISSGSGSIQKLKNKESKDKDHYHKEKDKPVLLVPLKTETSVATPSKPAYPKESYLYHVMGRSSSTFAPYQRSLNFIPDFYPQHQPHLLVPFSSWLELSDGTQQGVGGVAGSKQIYPGCATVRIKNHQNGRSSRSSARLLSSSSSSSSSKVGTTSKILLRDVGGNYNSMWASLSQRFKRNVRENLIPKLNGMWNQGGETGGNGKGNKKRANKKVTFNAWATVQMV